MILERYWHKRHLKRNAWNVQKKIYDLLFLRDKYKEMREGFRTEYDALKERLDAAQRRLMEEKYQFFYCASGDEIQARNLPIMISDMEKLPDEPKDTRDFRFYKKPRLNPDQKVCDNLEDFIKKHSDDLVQLEKQMQGIDGKIEGEGGVNELIEANRTVIDIIRKHIKKI